MKRKFCASSTLCLAVSLFFCQAISAAELLYVYGDILITDSAQRKLFGNSIHYEVEVAIDPNATTKYEWELHNTGYGWYVAGYPFEVVSVKISSQSFFYDSTSLAEIHHHFQVEDGYGEGVTDSFEILFGRFDDDEGFNFRSKGISYWTQFTFLIAGPPDTFVGNEAGKISKFPDLDANKYYSQMYWSFSKANSPQSEPVYTFYDNSPEYGVVGLDKVVDFKWPVGSDRNKGGHFGPCNDNPDCYWLSDDTESFSSDWRDVQPFLRHPFVNSKKQTRYHLGADYNLGSGNNDLNQLIFPIADGKVVAVHEDYCYWGNIVFVEHEGSTGPITSMYAHVSWLPQGPPEVGDSVYASTAFTLVGTGQYSCNGGGNYGAHLHLEVREGVNTKIGSGYQSTQSGLGPQGQIDPNAFIRNN